MHELSLAGSILKLVEDAAARDGFTRVARLSLEAGALAGVEVPALRFALESIAPGTPLDGAEIHIDTPPARASCKVCGASVIIASRTEPCPACGAWALVPTGGTELTLRELLVHEGD